MKLLNKLGLVALLCGVCATSVGAQSRVVHTRIVHTRVIPVRVVPVRVVPVRTAQEPRHCPIPRRVPHYPRRYQSGRHFNVVPRMGHDHPIIHVWRTDCR